MTTEILLVHTVQSDTFDVHYVMPLDFYRRLLRPGITVKSKVAFFALGGHHWMSQNHHATGKNVILLKEGGYINSSLEWPVYRSLL